MEDRSSSYCIIGAGPVGLCMARALKKAGIPYEQLEADADVGGNWRHGVYPSAHIISSRKTTEYTDYPMPRYYPDFPSAGQMRRYLEGYADHFQLRQHIQFKTRVGFCRPLADHRWAVTLANGEERTYRGVLVCNGHHWDCRWPSYPGQFTGEYIHSKEYKSPEQLRGKRVLVIGAGNSACDIASEAARVGATCAMSMRRGYWFLPKTIAGKPLAEWTQWWMPVWFERILLWSMLKLVVGKYERYGLPRPDHKLFEAHPTISSEVLHYLKHGRIRRKGDIIKFDGRFVEFGIVEFDYRNREEFDLIVAATGFHVSFPFLPEGLVPVKGGLAMLYAGCVLPTVKNLYVIGTEQVRYGFGPHMTPEGDMVAKMIQLQEKMELPIGLVMKESGMGLPSTHLVDPHAAIRRLRRIRWTLPFLLRRERKLRRRIGLPTPPSSESPQSRTQVEVC